MNHVTSLTCTDETEVDTGLEMSSINTSPRPPDLNLSLAYCAESFTFEEKRKKPFGTAEEYAFGHVWAFYSCRGKRRVNREDTFCAHPFYVHSTNNDPISLFAVFDGHGGDHASKYACKRIPLLFSSYLKQKDSIREALTNAFLGVDRELTEKSGPEKKAEKPVRAECFKRANSGGFLGAITLQRALSNRKVNGVSVDASSPQIFRRANSKAEDHISSTTASTHAACGTTATAAVLFNDKLMVAHVGDSRAVLILQDGSAIRLFEDHRPAREDEKARVEGAGGVFFNDDPKHMRVDGVLAITRAIGRPDLRTCVIPDPEVSVRVLRGDEAFLIVASDGLWDYVDDEECASHVQKVFDGKCESNKEVEGMAAKDLAQVALERGSTDDISVLVVNLVLHRQSTALHSEQRRKGLPEKQTSRSAHTIGSSGGKGASDGVREVRFPNLQEENEDECPLPLETPRHLPNRPQW